jgi:hypothetical protein
VHQHLPAPGEAVVFLCSNIYQHLVSLLVQPPLLKLLFVVQQHLPAPGVAAGATAAI